MGKVKQIGFEFKAAAISLTAGRKCERHRFDSVDLSNHEKSFVPFRRLSEELGGGRCTTAGANLAGCAPPSAPT